MDVKMIGAFLAQLRKEKDLTQEQLGQILGVTNKTVSRWENGNYLPPVEMLQQLSEFYGLSINEILSGKPLSETEYRDQAEENIKSVLVNSSFTVRERIDYFKKKWKTEHRFTTILGAGLLLAGFMVNAASSTEDWAFLFMLGLLTFCTIRYNVMMAYVEGKVYDVPDTECDTDRQKHRYLKRLRVAALLILGISIVITADLGYNFYASTIPEINDGLTLRGLFTGLIFGDQGWSRAWFFEAFSVSGACTVGLTILNLGLACYEKLKK